MTGRRQLALLTMGLAALLAGGAARADDAARAALDKARALNRGERHWSDRRQRMTLTVVDRRGTEFQRELEVMSKRSDGDAVRSLMFFHAPTQVAGIGFLQWTDPRSDDHQWLWLPALKRVRQISGGARGESFVGTDFSYEDLAIMAEAVDWQDDKAPAKMVGQETVDGVPCDVIERRPTASADISYGAVRLWLARDDQTVRKFELRRTDDTLAKTLLLSDIRPEKNIPTARRLEMRNEKTGSHTTVVVSELSYDTGIADEEFTQRRLEKGL
ncbi:MAG TPA: outer membrane lipoprotein-sorting protein [Candidatus Dormibacteraeota bacterium]|nr:outer membrane lipoprotein-sorting protein [Candidatus Dormibacteraeota bacterium]